MIDWPKVVQDLEKENARLKKALAEPQWVGLTDDEIAETWSKCIGLGTEWDDIKFARAIEAKLKERNT